MGFGLHANSTKETNLKKHKLWINARIFQHTVPICLVQQIIGTQKVVSSISVDKFVRFKYWSKEMMKFI